MWKEFRDFAMSGSIIDMAVGIIIGGAFQKIINALVNDIIMPLISIFIGTIDFNDWVISVGQISIKFGSFFTTIINFLIIAFSVFMFIKYINRLNRQLEETGSTQRTRRILPRWIKLKEHKRDIPERPSTKLCPYCMTKINIRATRCPHCTSDLTVKEEKEETLDNQIELQI